jgi:hypothetical protein
LPATLSHQFQTNQMMQQVKFWCWLLLLSLSGIIFFLAKIAAQPGTHNTFSPTPKNQAVFAKTPANDNQVSL